MNRICWWLVDRLSRTLEPNERDAVRGDLAEAGVTGAQALRDLLGLVVRRQAMLWKDWRPWLALVGLAVPLGVLLSLSSALMSRSYELYFWIAWNYRVIDPTILRETGLTLRHGVPILVCKSLLSILSSWISGFVLGSLSRRTVWVNGALFYLAWLCFPVAPRGVLPLTTYAVLFLLPSMWGVHQGLRLGTLRLRQTILLAAAMAFMTALTTPTGWRMQGLVPALLKSWPAGYLLAVASSRQWKMKAQT